MRTDESAIYDMLSEEERAGLGPAVKESCSAHSFREALALLDMYPWFRLIPLEVHPEYLDAVVHAVCGANPGKEVGVDYRVRKAEFVSEVITNSPAVVATLEALVCPGMHCRISPYVQEFIATLPEDQRTPFLHCVVRVQLLALDLVRAGKLCGGLQVIDLPSQRGASYIALLDFLETWQQVCQLHCEFPARQYEMLQG